MGMFIIDSVHCHVNCKPSYESVDAKPAFHYTNANSFVSKVKTAFANAFAPSFAPVIA